MKLAVIQMAPHRLHLALSKPGGIGNDQQGISFLMTLCVPDSGLAQELRNAGKKWEKGKIFHLFPSFSLFCEVAGDQDFPSFFPLFSHSGKKSLYDICQVPSLKVFEGGIWGISGNAITLKRGGGAHRLPRLGLAWDMAGSRNPGDPWYVHGQPVRIPRHNATI